MVPVKIVRVAKWQSSPMGNPFIVLADPDWMIWLGSHNIVCLNTGLQFGVSGFTVLAQPVLSGVYGLHATFDEDSTLILTGLCRSGLMMQVRGVTPFAKIEIVKIDRASIRFLEFSSKGKRVIMGDSHAGCSGESNAKSGKSSN